MRGTTVNYLLIALGGVMIIAELLLGAITGFDLALLGVAVAAGGAVGLYFDSVRVGLFSAGGLSLGYLLFLRKWIRLKLTATGRPALVQELVGRSGVVTVRIAPHEPGQVKLGDEIWRATLASGTDGAPESGTREPGATVTVDSVDGVTLIVK